jgi:hypothetical protein
MRASKIVFIIIALFIALIPKKSLSANQWTLTWPFVVDKTISKKKSRIIYPISYFNDSSMSI